MVANIFSFLSKVSCPVLMNDNANNFLFLIKGHSISTHPPHLHVSHHTCILFRYYHRRKLMAITNFIVRNNIKKLTELRMGKIPGWDINKNRRTDMTSVITTVSLMENWILKAKQWVTDILHGYFWPFYFK